MFEGLSESDIDMHLVQNGLMTMDDYVVKWYGADRLGWEITFEQYDTGIEAVYIQDTIIIE